MYKITIDQTKGIGHLEFNVPEHKGVYLLTGINGSGKTTLMTAIHRMGNKTAFTALKVGKDDPNAYAIDRYRNARITYTDGANSVTYKRHNIRWVPSPKSASRLLNNFPYHDKMTFISTSGMRFYTQEYDAINRQEPLHNASQSIRNGLNAVFNTRKFDNLKYVTVRNMHGRQRQLHRANKLYLIDDGARRKYTELNFSLGERLVLNTLDEIDNLGKNSFLLIDEMELALHPIAQVAFYDMLTRMAQDHDLIVILSTHSVSLINHAEKRIYLQKDDNGNVTAIENCYAAYILNTISTIEDIKPDFVFFVEDKMAYFYLLPILRFVVSSNNLPINYQILPVGGYKQVVELTERSVQMGLDRRKVQAFLDYDAKDSIYTLLHNAHRTNAEENDYQLYTRMNNYISYLDITPEVEAWLWLENHGVDFQTYIRDNLANPLASIPNLISQAKGEENGNRPQNPSNSNSQSRKWAKGCFRNIEDKMTTTLPGYTNTDIDRAIFESYVKDKMNDVHWVNQKKGELLSLFHRH
jgi:ABC-type multidrug transport system ATPase subunit